MTVFGTGVAPTVTVTPLAQMITQEITITVNENGAGATNAPAGVSMPGAVGTGAVTQSIAPGVNPPAGGVGTGASSLSTAAIANPSNPAVAASGKFLKDHE